MNYMKTKISILGALASLIINFNASNAITPDQLDKCLKTLPSDLLSYASEIRIKDTPDYQIPNRIILADANTNYVINIYQNNLSDDQLCDIIRHEIGHCVYWKTKQEGDLEQYADWFRQVSYWYNTVDEIQKYLDWIR